MWQSLKVVLALASWVALVGTVPADDLVVTTDGKRHRGTIVSETRTHVVLRTRTGQTLRIPVDQVDRVQYDGPGGTALSQAIFAERAGQLEQALERYDEVIEQAREGEATYVAAQLGRARALARAALLNPSDATEAEDALLEFLRRYPNTRHYYPALMWLARVRLAAGKGEEARRTLEQLAEAPLASYAAFALGELAKLLVTSNQAEQAERMLRDQLQKELPEEARWQLELALAEVLAAREQVEEAVALVRKVIDEIPEEQEQLNAQAFLTLGRIYERAGKAVDAILAYLYVDLIYRDSGELRAEALARLAELWEEVGRPDRAREARETLQREFPNSRWAKAE